MRWSRSEAARLSAAGISERGPGAPEILTLDNWPDPAITVDPEAAARFRAEHGLAGRFVAMYSGNFGKAHPFDAILDAAAFLRDRRPDIVFAMIGTGARHAAVAAAAERLGLSNMRFLPLQPAARLSASLGAADLHLATMTPDAAGLMVPSKVSGALAAGRPCWLLGPADGAAAALLRDCGVGLVLPPADGAGLAARLDQAADRLGRCAPPSAAALAAVAPLRLDRAAPVFIALAAELAMRGRARLRTARPAAAEQPAITPLSQGGPHG